MKSNDNTNYYNLGDYSEIKVLTYLKKHPQFKSLNIQKCQTNNEGIDFEGVGGDNVKIGFQVKYSKNPLNEEIIYRFLKVLPKQNYISAYFIHFGTGQLTKGAHEAINNSSIPVVIWNNPDLSKISTSNFSLRDYQEAAIKAAKVHFLKEDKGILEMACGTGKTLVAQHIVKTILPQGGLVFFFTPWLSLLEQSIRFLNDEDILSIPVCSTENKIKNKIAEDDNSIALINLETLLVKATLEKLLNENRYVIIFCTYKSFQRLAEKQKNGELKKADLVICDEAHHTIEPSLFNEFRNFHQDIKTQKTLFMTATVKIIMQKTNNAKKIINSIFDMSNKDLYGTKFFTLQLQEAIDRKALVDFEVFLPRFVSLGEAKRVHDLLPSVIKEKIDRCFKIRLSKKNQTQAEYKKLYHKMLKERRLHHIIRMVGIFKALKENNCQSILAFVSGITKDRAQLSQEYFQYLLETMRFLENNDSLGLPYQLTTDYIDGKMNPAEREVKMTKLEQQKPFLLWNCRCLVEGIDIPQCDTVVFFDFKYSYIDALQAVGRALRLDPENKAKMAKIILPFDYDRYESIDKFNQSSLHFLSFLSYLKESNKKRKSNGTSEGNTGSTTGSKNNIPVISKKIIKKFRDLTEKEKIAIDEANRLIEIEKIKIAKTNWDGLVIKIIDTLRNIQKDIFKQNQQEGAFSNIHQQFAIVFNIDPEELSKEKTVLIIAQYLLFYPILNQVYEINYIVCPEFNNIINKLAGIETIKAQYIDSLITDFWHILNFNNKNIAEKEEILEPFFNEVITKLDPELKRENGMYFTPKWVVEILWKILIHVGKIDFKQKRYHIIDPAAGSGAFISYLMRNIITDRSQKKAFYEQYLHIREINFMTYMISCFRLAFAAEQPTICPHIHWGDSLAHYINETASFNQTLISQQMISEQRKFTIVITNPPWRNGQIKDEGKRKSRYIPSENYKPNKNDYWVDERIQATFVKNTITRNKNSLYNMYRRFVRWGLDHLTTQFNSGGGGWLAMVLPESFLEENVEGFRLSLTEECDEVYIVNLRGGANFRNGKKASVEGENIFKVKDMQDSNTQGTVLLICHKPPVTNNIKNHKTYYHLIRDGLNNHEKQEYLLQNYQNQAFFQEELKFDNEKNWFNKPEYAPKTWQALTHKDVIGNNKHLTNFFFQEAKLGLASACSKFVYDNNKDNLKIKMKKFIDFYNECRLKKTCQENPTIIKWHDNLRKRCLNNVNIVFDEKKIKLASYKPFRNHYFYADPLIISRFSGQHKHYFQENISLCVSVCQINFSCLIVNHIPDRSILYVTQCYALSELIPQLPYNQKEWMAILYALCHHPEYRQAAKNFLKHHLPTIPPLNEEIKQQLLYYGEKLIHLHLNFDKLPNSKEIIDPVAFNETTLPENYEQYHREMPFVPEKALKYHLFNNEPLLYTYRKNSNFAQLVTLAIKTNEILVDIKQIDLNLKN